MGEGLRTIGTWTRPLPKAGTPLRRVCDAAARALGSIMWEVRQDLSTRHVEVRVRPAFVLEFPPTLLVEGTATGVANALGRPAVLVEIATRAAAGSTGPDSFILGRVIERAKRDLARG